MLFNNRRSDILCELFYRAIVSGTIVSEDWALLRRIQSSEEPLTPEEQRIIDRLFYALKRNRIKPVGIEFSLKVARVA
jgi:hypothetical protein